MNQKKGRKKNENENQKKNRIVRNDLVNEDVKWVDVITYVGAFNAIVKLITHQKINN